MIITRHQRAELRRHLRAGGSLPVQVRGKNVLRTRIALARRGLVRFDRSWRPRRSALTVQGIVAGLEDQL